MSISLYLSRPWVSCFEGEGAGDGAGAGAGASAGAGAGDGAGASDDVKAPEGFTAEQQKKFNDAIAAERRKQEGKFRQAQETLKKTEKQYQELLASAGLTEQERKALQANLEVVQGQLRSKEEQLQVEKKQIEEAYAGKLQELEKKASFFETLYRDSTIERALQDAAVKHEAWSPSQIVTQLRGQTKMLEETDPKTGKLTGKYRPMVEMLTLNTTTGETETKAYTPEEAVKRMKDDKDTWGNLFKSGVVSGIGAGTATGGLTPGQSGRLDAAAINRLSPAQYREIRAKHPEWLGLNPLPSKEGR
jgi:hypothetical protein